MSITNFKIKPLCDVFGENTIWNLLYVHVLFATTLGWGYFIFGNIHYIHKGFDFSIILEHNAQSAIFAMWTASFLLAIHWLKKYGKRDN